MRTDEPEDLRSLQQRINSICGFENHLFEAFDTIGSTNDYIKTGWGGSNIFIPRVATASNQTAGRGRHGRSWHNVKGESLLFSFSIKMATEKFRSLLFSPSLATGTAVCRAIRDEVESPEQITLKWPNDIVSKKGKLGGVLLESAVQQDTVFLVAGIGLNLHKTPLISQWESQLPPDCLVNHGFQGDRDSLMLKILATWSKTFSDYDPDRLVKVFNLLAEPFLGKTTRLQLPDQTIVEGWFEGVNNKGEAVISRSDKTRRSISNAIRVEFRL